MKKIVFILSLIVVSLVTFSFTSAPKLKPQTYKTYVVEDTLVFYNQTTYIVTWGNLAGYLLNNPHIISQIFNGIDNLDFEATVNFAYSFFQDGMGIVYGDGWAVAPK